MKALLILAHGSRKKESNDEILALARELNERPGKPFDKVLCAFNQFSGPTAGEQIKVLAEQGVRDITVLPYFIAAGSHVVSDIPELVREAARTYPDIRFHVTPHLGAFKGIQNLILSELGSELGNRSGG